MRWIQAMCGTDREDTRLAAAACPRVLTALRWVVAMLAVCLAAATQAQTYQITAASPAYIPAGVAGANLAISGTLPDFTQGYFQVCFYTGYGSTAAITPTTTNGVTSIAIPATTIQSIPFSSFNAGNNHSLAATVFIQYAGVACSGTPQASLTNTYIEPVSEPLIAGLAGSAVIPQTNTTTGVQPPPANLVFYGSNFGPTSVIAFGQGTTSYGSYTPTVLSPTTLSVPVPASFASAAVGTQAIAYLCYKSNAAGTCVSDSTSVTVTLTVGTPVASMGTLTATPTPTTTTGTTTLTAQFAKKTGSTAPEPGVPSGTVTFAANGSTVSTKALTLDSTATVVSSTTATQVQTAAAPTLTPPTGTYASATVRLTDNTLPTASIYYTLDGTTPTTSSTRYKAPFALTATATVTAIAAEAGYLNSAPVSNTITIFVPTPTSLSFTTQPSTTATSTAISPAVTVAVLDQNGNTITNSTAPVTLALGANPGQSTLAGTLTVNAVNGVATFSDLSIAGIANGYTLVASSGNLTTATSSAFNITPYPITVKLFDPLIGVTSTLQGSFTLTHAAPQGGVTVALASSSTSLLTVSPATVNVPAGGTTGTFSYTGVAPGTAMVTASAPNYLAGSASVTVTNSLVSLGTIPTVAPGQTVSLALSIATAAPAGGVTINFTSSNTGVATVTSSVFIPAGQRTAAANPQVVGVTIGTTTITATAQGYAPDTRSVSVTVTAGFSPTNISISRGTYSTVTLNISAPAQTGGLTFTVSSDDTSKVTTVSSVTIPAGQTSVVIPITGVADGNTVIRADSPGVTESTLSVSVNSGTSIYYGNQTTGVNLQVVNYLYLNVGPPAPVTLTVTSSNPAVATLSKSNTVVGGSSLTFTNVTSAGNTGPVYIQGQSVGTTTLTLSAPGYTTSTAVITVYPSGFTFAGSYSGGLSTSTFSSATSLPVYASILNPGTLTYYGTAQLNPGLGGVTVPITSSNTAVGTITTSPLTFNAGDQALYTSFQPSSAGTSTIAVGSPSPAAGFSTPAQYTNFTATVTAPSSSFYYGNTTTGVNLQQVNYLYLPQTPPSGITLTVTSSDPTVATVSKSNTVVGTASVQFANVTSSGNTGPIYIQGLKVGSTTFTLTAPGFVSSTITVTVYPSGFTYAGSYNGGLSTTSFSSATNLPVYASILNPSTLTYYGTGQLNPGIGSVTVPVTSSNTTVGTITSSPVTFNAGDTTMYTSFQPSSAGTSTITLGTPSPATGFSTPAQYTSFTATVTAPQASFYYGNTVTGVNLQETNYLYLPQNPPGPVTVTVTSSDPTVATVSKSATVVGTTSVSFANVTTAGNSGPIYIQGQKVGSTTFTVTANGYTSNTITVTVYPSGFSFAGSYNGGLSTTTFSSTTSIPVYASILNPSTLTYYGSGQTNPGLGTITVPVTSSNTVVGTVSPATLSFNAGDTVIYTAFQPTSAGTTTIAVGAPSPSTGFSTPSQYTSFTATVTAPQASFYYGNQTTGVNLQTNNYVYLPQTPPNAVTATVTSNGPAIATVSTSATTVGTASISFPNITSNGNVAQVFIQGQSVGSTTLTVAVPGYTNGTITVTVNPSGFTTAGAYNGGLNTTTTSGTSTFNVVPSVLNTGTLTYYTNQPLNPGLGGVSVMVTSSNPATGTITTSPLVFGDASNSLSTGFKPLATGTSTISITQPTGFLTPSNYVQFTATVQ